MKPAAAKVSGNQGRMAGRRLAVGFRQIVLGEFPAGVVTDRLRKNVRWALLAIACGVRQGYVLGLFGCAGKTSNARGLKSRETASYWRCGVAGWQLLRGEVFPNWKEMQR